MRTANPALNSSTFNVRYGTYAGAMTINGTIWKTLVLLACVLATAGWTWDQFMTTRDPGVVMPCLMGGGIVGLVLAFVTIFKKEWAGVTAPLYSLAEGLVLGGLSALFELRFPGIAIEAVGLTFGTCLCMLVAYRLGIIRVTQRFTMVLVAATGGICLVYFLTMILGFFHVQVPAIYGSGPIGILFSLFVVGVAALNLVLDFSFIEQGALNGAPKYMEWYGAFGLMVTLIWLYMEMLRLLAKLRDRR
ncbi:MAG: Bax inhibitor-1/YccA family protein [Acidobacteriaceae bacterium]|nr:Bax inhibitor-1/YccA family protein [Acidobacteriaceae bacterium]